MNNDWSKLAIVRPSFIGTKVFMDYDLARVLPWIDWDPFFSTWGLRGKYPNRTYPKIFKDKTVGEEAKKLFDAAQKMLTQVIGEKLIEARGIVGFYPCNSDGVDDIEVYDPEDEVTPISKFFTLR